MKTSRTCVVVFLLAALAIPFLAAGCGGEPDEREPAEQAGANVIGDFPQPIPPEDLRGRIEKYAMVQVAYDESVLSDPEKEALAKLVEAAREMDEVFLRQVWSGNVEMRSLLRRSVELAGSSEGNSQNAEYLKDLEHYFRINVGPWDRLQEDKPFIGTTPKPAGANLYPEAMTKEEFEAHVEANPTDEDAFRGFFTTIRREGGKLVAVPYSKEYREHLEKAAALMHEAADILAKPENQAKLRDGVDYKTLAKFLRSRADAFMSNDYFQSDMDWMDVRDNVIDVTIGPYEVYEDALNSYKAAFEAFIAIKHPQDSARLEGIKRYMQLLENSLPIPDEHKNPNRGSESPVSVVDVVFTAGDTKAGVQTVAFNLPNDERVREAKGSKKVMLKNITQAKFEKILVPIAKEVLDPAQLEHVDFDAYFTNVLVHEIAHGLGPGIIKGQDGKETTVSRELKETYPPLEECKADILGLFCQKVLIEQGFFEKGSEVQGYVSFLPGFFRAIRFGATSAHGKANMMEFNFMREQGAIALDPATDRFRVNIDKMPAAVEALSNRLLMIQATGDYQAAKDFLAKYGEAPSDLGRFLEKLAAIPVDIEPLYSAEEMLSRR